MKNINHKQQNKYLKLLIKIKTDLELVSIRHAAQKVVRTKKLFKSDFVKFARDFLINKPIKIKKNQ